MPFFSPFFLVLQIRSFGRTFEHEEEEELSGSNRNRLLIYDHGLMMGWFRDLDVFLGLL